MFTGNYQTLLGIGAYLIAMIIIGLHYVRRGKTSLGDYYLANRGFGPWTASMGAGAADMSGWLLLGLPGVAYFTGMGEAFWTALGLFIGTCVNWMVVARRLRSYSIIADNSITLPEFLSRRFRDKNNFLSVIAATINLVFFSLYTSAQFITFGKLFNYLFGANMVAMIIVGAFIVVFYTLLGGLRAVGMTNLVQGLLMAFALAMVLAFGYFHAGGIKNIAGNLRDFPRFTDFFGIASPGTVGGLQITSGGVPVFGPGTHYSFLNIESAMAWGLGYFGMPHILIRFMAVNKASMIRPARFIAITWCFIVLAAAVSIGLIGRALFPTTLNSSSSSENIFIILSMNLFPPLLTGVVISGILAASMSSADSYMLMVSSSLALDIYKGVLKKEASDNEVIWVGRITMLLATVFGVAVAVSGNQSIFQVVSYAWAGLGAAFGPLILFSLFWKRTTLPAAVTGMITGCVMVVLWKNVIADFGGIFAVYELLPAFIISSLAIVFVSLLTKKPSEEISKEFAEAVQGQ